MGLPAFGVWLFKLQGTMDIQNILLNAGVKKKWQRSQVSERNGQSYFKIKHIMNLRCSSLCDSVSFLCRPHSEYGGHTCFVAYALVSPHSANEHCLKHQLRSQTSVCYGVWAFRCVKFSALKGT